MRNVTYFPPYSQEENVVTNSVLLLLSHVNRIDLPLLGGPPFKLEFGGYGPPCWPDRNAV